MASAPAHAPEAWLQLAAELAASPWRRLMVLGAGDRGKSTLVRTLAERLSAAGERVRLLDCDLGQKAVGPPGCVTLGEWQGGFALSRLAFVGATSPTGVATSLVAGAARLALGVCDGRLLINTSGFVTGPGLALKRWKVEALDPDRVVILARDGEEPALAEIVPPARLVRLASSPRSRRKGEAQRARARAAGFAAALAGAPELAVRPALVEPVMRDALAPGALRLIGLADRDGEDLGIGLASPPGDSEAWRIRSFVDPDRVWRLRVGMAIRGELGD